MGKKSEGLSAVLKRLGPAKAKEMDEAAKRGMFGQPEKAAKKEKNVTLSKKEMEDLQKSLNEKKKSKGAELTKSEEDAMDRIARRRVREGGSERGEGMGKADKNRRLTKKEQEREQEMLKFKKGGMVKSYAKGGMTTKKMMGGGMSTMKYAKGGMANCGASVKPSGGSRNK